MLGITLRGAERLGDKLQFASFPENYYRNTGDKIIDLDRAWIFDHNPFVVREKEPTEVLNLWTHPWPNEARRVPGERFIEKPVFFSIAEKTALKFNHLAYLRHPRLYKYEDLPTITNRVVVHTTGRRGAPVLRGGGEDQARFLPEEILEHIRIKYREYEVIQVGAKDDIDARVIDCRGLESVWDTVRLIAQAAIFIGVDSGPAWISACYPGIFRKKVLVQYPPEYLRDTFVPMHLLRPIEQWHDLSFLYYNRSKDDAGVTYSFLKL